MIKISIITPTYNSAKTLQKCLQSVFTQTYSCYEHLIIDNCSEDSTIQIIENYQMSGKLQYFIEKDEGVYDAMNKGIKKASGDYILFLGSDDFLFSDNVLNSVAQKIYQCDCDLLYGNSIFLSSGYVYDGKFNKLKLIQDNICHQSIFYKRTLFERFGLYDLKYKILSDWHYNMRAFNVKGMRISYIPIAVSYYNDVTGLTNEYDDYCFHKDKANIDKLFPFYIRFLYYNKKLLFVRFLRKIMYQPLSQYFNI